MNANVTAVVWSPGTLVIVSMVGGSGATTEARSNFNARSNTSVSLSLPRSFVTDISSGSSNT